MTEKKILRLPSVMEATGLSRSLIYQYVKQGKFPQPIKLGERASGWLVDEIDEWISARAAARSEPSGV